MSAEYQRAPKSECASYHSSWLIWIYSSWHIERKSTIRVICCKQTPHRYVKFHIIVRDSYIYMSHEHQIYLRDHVPCHLPQADASLIFEIPYHSSWLTYLYESRTSIYLKEELPCHLPQAQWYRCAHVQKKRNHHAHVPYLTHTLIWECAMTQIYRSWLVSSAASPVYLFHDTLSNNGVRSQRRDVRMIFFTCHSNKAHP